VIGDPVRHTRSPALHNAAYAALGLDWAYGAFPVAPWQVDGAVVGAASLGFVGLSVTMPHKGAVLRVADGVSATVERLGSANTLRFERGQVWASSTDGAGLVADLRSAGFEPEGAQVVVLGAGGAARAAILALSAAGARQVVVVNRTEDRAQAAGQLAGPVGRVGGPEAIDEAGLVVKATPVGMPVGPAAGGPPAGGPTAGGPPTGGPPTASYEGAALGARCRPGQLVVDLVYHPPCTPFLEAAAAAGATVRNGLGMLVHQAALQVTTWSGEVAPLAAMWAVVGGEEATVPATDGGPPHPC
jgi:shikimate dehydrogenase